MATGTNGELVNEIASELMAGVPPESRRRVSVPTGSEQPTRQEDDRGNVRRFAHTQRWLRTNRHTLTRIRARFSAVIDANGPKRACRDFRFPRHDWRMVCDGTRGHDERQGEMDRTYASHIGGLAVDPGRRVHSRLWLRGAA